MITNFYRTRVRSLGMLVSDNEKRVDNSLVQIWKVNFGHKVKFLFEL